MQVQVSRLLGEGGYAFIYSAKEMATGKEFALKDSSYLRKVK